MERKWYADCPFIPCHFCPSSCFGSHAYKQIDVYDFLYISLSFVPYFSCQIISGWKQYADCPFIPCQFCPSSGLGSHACNELKSMISFTYMPLVDLEDLKYDILGDLLDEKLCGIISLSNYFTWH